MSWISRLLLQHIAVFFVSTGAFAAGVVLGWNSFGGWMLRASVGWGQQDADLAIGIVAAGSCLGALLLNLLNIYRHAHVLAYAYIMLLIQGWLFIYRSDKWHQYTMLLIGRTLSGMGIGIFTTLLPVYIGEIASPERRDRLCYFTHATLNCGIVVSYALTDTKAEDLKSYNLYCGLVCLPAILCIMTMQVNPVENMINGKQQEARNALLFYDLTMDETQVNRRMEELRELIQKDGRTKSFFANDCQFQFWTLLALTICHHLSGAITVLFNGLVLFDFVGSGAMLTSSQMSLICSVCQVVANLLGLLLVDRLGRRILLTFSATMMALAMGLLGWTMNAMQTDQEIYPWLSPMFVALYYSACGLGFGPVVWAMLSDSFPMDMRIVGASIIGASGWLVSLLLNVYISNFLETLGVAKLLWLFVGFSLLGALLGSCLVRETRGKSLLDLQRQFLNG